MENKNLKEEKELDSCDCGDNCQCGDDCDCGDNCQCADEHDFEDSHDCGCGEDHTETHCLNDDMKSKCFCTNPGKCPGKAILGLIIVVFGVIYLGKNLAWWSFSINWAIFFPIVVISCGLLMIIRSRR